MVIEHAVIYLFNWLFDTGAVVAVQVVDKSGRVLGEWVDLDSRREVRTYWPAGADFVGLRIAVGRHCSCETGRRCR